MFAKFSVVICVDITNNTSEIEICAHMFKKSVIFKVKNFNIIKNLKNI